MTNTGAVLQLPDLAKSLAWLRDCADPVVQLRLASDIDSAPQSDIDSLRRTVAESAIVQEALATQRPDGSWGDKERSSQRLLPTLWMAKTLGEFGLNSDHPDWLRAVEFLQRTGHTDEGVFSISGRREGVLSCYVGTVALLYHQGGREDLVRSHIDWILRYQEVRTHGKDSRRAQVDQWGSYLKSRYGGCMSGTTCLVGLLRQGRALVYWLAINDEPEARELVDTMRQVFLKRRVMFRGNGSIVPLAVSPKNAEDWLSPTYPLDWRVDLIEAVDFLGRSGPVDPRMSDAIDHIVDLQLPDGSWPLRRTYRPEFLPKLESRSTRRGSPMITLRVVDAIRSLYGAAG